MRASFNQSGWQRKPPSQQDFLFRHFAPIAFMIISRQVQNSMQNQDSNFVGDRVLRAAAHYASSNVEAKPQRRPAKLLAVAAAGKDNTSVDWFLPRKREFNCRILNCPVIKMLTAPCSPAASLALRTKLESNREFSFGGLSSRKIIVGLVNFI